MHTTAEKQGGKEEQRNNMDVKHVKEQEFPSERPTVAEKDGSQPVHSPVLGQSGTGGALQQFIMGPEIMKNQQRSRNKVWHRQEQTKDRVHNSTQITPQKRNVQNAGEIGDTQADPESQAKKAKKLNFKLQE
ncbi:unnamed protein product [Linum trigynum]|uniref:Uncharacterized protein n=1 Tax=Linum trigynum TaxID=586398 RepID=A0AAV2DP87_9ROSI